MSPFLPLLLAHVSLFGGKMKNEVHAYTVHRQQKAVNNLARRVTQKKEEKLLIRVNPAR